jgi:hypothetical protein
MTFLSYSRQTLKYLYYDHHFPHLLYFIILNHPSILGYITYIAEKASLNNGVINNSGSERNQISCSVCLRTRSPTSRTTWDINGFRICIFNSSLIQWYRATILEQFREFFCLCFSANTNFPLFESHKQFLSNFWR